MADIVNLRRFRKARLRSEAEKAAEQNRAAFGRTKADRALSEARADQALRRLDGHRRTSADGGEEADRADLSPES